MYSTRPKRQGIKVRGRDKSKSIKGFKLATGHRAILRTEERAVKLVVRQTPDAGDRTFQGEVVGVKRLNTSRHGKKAAQPKPPVGSMSGFTMANVFAVEV